MSILAILLVVAVVGGFVLVTIGKSRMLFDVALAISVVVLLLGGLLR